MGNKENTKTYYALADMQNYGRLLHTGRNTTNKLELLKDFIGYIMVDVCDEELPKEKEKEYLKLAKGDYENAIALYYFDLYKDRQEELFGIWEFELEKQNIPFYDE